MTPFAGELVGTALFVMIGNAVQANLSLARTRADGSGAGGAGAGGAAGAGMGASAAAWLTIAFGWALGYFTGAAVSAHASGAHLNPAVTLGIWQTGGMSADSVPAYLAGQFIGAAVGAIAVLLVFLPHWGRTDDPSRKLACFATAPAVRAPLSNLVGEALGAFVLVLGVLLFREVVIAPAQGSVPSAMQAVAAVDVDMGALGALPIALLLLAIALGIGGTVGVGFNPARDLAPRLVHAVAPIPGKGGSDWAFAWIPVVGPLLGAMAAVAAVGVLSS